jgi:xanthine dehydrogenase accessory factor
MDSVNLEVLKAAINWSAAGRYTLLATVVRTWGSAPRPIGSMMAIREDGHVIGSISGGCIEDDLVCMVRDGEHRLITPASRTYGISADEAHRFGLPCGGTMEIVLEPVTAASRLDALLEHVKSGSLVTREVDLASGAVQLTAGAQVDQLAVQEQRLLTVHGPRYRLVIIGAAQLSTYVAQIAKALDYQVIVCDPREEYLDEWSVAGVELSREMPDDLLVRLGLDSHSALLTLTHDPKLDDMALLEGLKSPAFYVGAIGSRSNHQKRRERLKLFDIGDADIARLHGPVGLHVGARTPPEIAVAILAEMTAIRHGVPILQTHAARPASPTTSASACGIG